MKTSIMNAINQISSIEEMNEVINLIKLKQRQLRDMTAFNVKSSITVGMKVKINSSRGDMFGIVEKIKQKKAIVNVDGRTWDCPLTLIEAA
jgi:hypothetical protein